MSKAQQQLLRRFYRQERRKGYDRAEAWARVQARRNRLLHSFSLLETTSDTFGALNLVRP